MLDCLVATGGVISGFARGIPREYQVHNVPLADSRARFEEAYEIVTRAWTEDVFSYSGKFWSLQGRVDLAAARCGGPIRRSWIPIVGSQESIEFAGRHNIGITPGLAGGGLRDDIVRHYAQSPGRGGPSHHARSPVARASTPMSPIPRPRRCARWGPITSISTRRCSAMAASPKRRHSGRSVTSASIRPITCGRRTSARLRCCARISATLTLAHVRAPGREHALRHARGSGRADHRPGRAWPAPTWCRSASIVGRCRTTCSSTRSAASPARCCRSCRPIASSACPQSRRWRRRRTSGPARRVDRSRTGRGRARSARTRRIL